MTIHYEWDIETVCAKTDDIIDHNHRDRLNEFGMEELIEAINGMKLVGVATYTRLVLVRDKRDQCDNLDRSWAYVTDDGEMPEQFMDAFDKPVAKVPKRFIEEFKL
jgi:hypothetical protein